MNINKCIYSSSLYVTTVEAPFHLFPQILGINVEKKYAALLRAHAIYTPEEKGPFVVLAHTVLYALACRGAQNIEEKEKVRE